MTDVTSFNHIFVFLKPADITETHFLSGLQASIL